LDVTAHHIIVIGASAGGVETLKQLIQGLPQSIPATIFVVLHISPHAPSILPQILSRVTRIPVSHARHLERFEQGHIYVAPPDQHLLLTKQHIKLSRGPKVNASRPAIDALFQSAAHIFGGNVIGVVLTGMLADGSIGLQKIKQAGGKAIVQDPQDAIFPSMPQHAINTTAIDYILPIAQIAPQLMELVNMPVEEARVMPDKTNNHQDDNANEHVDVYTRGKPSTYVCPECGGVLAEFENGDALHFECRVGHAYSAESLFAIQSEAVEDALWMALRALEEGSSYTQRMAAQARENKHTVVEERFKAKLAEYERQADVLRQLLVGQT
jgi:two-component system chemotaxis response regulator CheB